MVISLELFNIKIEEARSLGTQTVKISFLFDDVRYFDKIIDIHSGLRGNALRRNLNVGGHLKSGSNWRYRTWNTRSWWTIWRHAKGEKG